MSRLGMLLRKLRFRLRRTRLSEELSEEMSIHLEMKAEELSRQGLSESEARLAARRSFGNLMYFQNQSLRVWGGTWLDDLLQDLRYASRMLRNHPRFSLTTLLTFALGMGLNTAMFTLVDSIVLRPLPFPNPDRLLAISGLHESGGGGNPLENTYQDFLAYRRARAFSAIAAFSLVSRNLEDPDGLPIKVQVGRVSGDLLGVLQATPVIGRGMSESELQSVEPVLLLEFGLWRDRYGGSSKVLGKTIRLGEGSYTVIGVMPRGFSYPPGVQAWQPLDYRSQDEDRELRIVARLSRNGTIEQAEQQIKSISLRLQEQYPETNEGIIGSLEPLRSAMTRQISEPLLWLWLAVSLILLIACLNLASLLLARCRSRGEEVGIRVALGATRGRIIRQSLTETLLLTLIGGGIGIALAAFYLRSIISWLPADIPRIHDVAIDATTLAYLSSCLALVGMATGLIPAIRLSKGSQSALAGNSRRTQTDNRGRFQFILLTLEAAFSVVLLMGAGLTVSSLINLISYDRGFRTTGLIVADLDRSIRFDSATQRVEFYREASSRIAQFPGVVRVAVGPSPLQALGLRVYFESPESTPEGSMPEPVVLRAVSTGYFQAAAIPLLAGREFSSDENRQAGTVALLNRAFLERYFPSKLPRDLIGSEIHLRFQGAAESTLVQVIGVVGDLRQPGQLSPLPAAYFPFAQTPLPSGLLIETGAPPSTTLLRSIRDTLLQLQPRLGVNRVEPIESWLSDGLTEPRLNASLISLFALLALFLSAIGIYGVVSFAVVERWREMAIRRTLGARRHHLLRSALTRSLLPVFVGSLGGVLASGWVAGSLRPYLFQVDRIDPLHLLLVLLVIWGVSIVAALIPAWKASRIDPLSALKAL